MNATTMKVDPKLRRQLVEGKTLLRELRETLEDLEDRIELARAKKKNAGKPGVSWAQAKKELGLDF